MSQLSSLLAALELTGGERIVLRSNELPHLMLRDTRHDLGTAAVPTTTGLEALADQILSPAGKQALAEQRVAVEPLVEHASAIPVRVMVRRIGAQMYVELQRDTQSSDTGHVAATAAAAAPVMAPSASAGRLVFSTAPATEVSAAEPVPPLESEPERVPKSEAPGVVVDGSKRPADVGALDYLIRQALRRKATALYLRGGHAPLVRVGGRVEPLTADPLEAAVIEAVGAAVIPGDDPRRSTSSAVWVREYEGTRQRWHAFTDERGPGLVVHLAWRSPESLLQRDIPRRVKRICQEDDGIVVVSAPATANVLQMIAAVGNWTASRRAGYLISIEPPGGLEHEITGTFVSARRVGGADNESAAAIRRAAHETPDVLVVALTSGVAAEEALRAARPGCLVILGVVAPTAPRALESLLANVSPQHEAEVRQSLAASFACGFSYRALHAAGGGRKVVYDLLIATPDVRARLERWDVGSLEKFQRSGTDGMRSLDAALAHAVLRGDISVRQAASHAVDRREVVKMIRQSARERLRLRP